jgi:hypothetical protein
MFRGFFALLFAAALTSAVSAAPIPRDPPKGAPHLVLQIKPLEGWLGDYEHIYPKIKDASKRAEEIPSPKKVRDFIDMFLPNWSTIVDQSQPWGMYTTFLSDPKEMRPVLVFPIKDAKAFAELIGSTFGDLTDEKEGIREFKYRLIFGAREPAYFRFKNDCAYVTFDNISAIKDADKLPHPRELFVKEETALLSARLFVEGIPAELKATAKEFLGKIESGKAGVGVPEMLLMGMIGAGNTKDFVGRLKQVIDEGKWFSLRLDFDRKTDEMIFEFNLIPRKDSALGKVIAEFKPRKTRFAELLDKDCPAGLVYSLGTFGGFKGDEKEIEEMVNALLDSIHLGGEAEKIRPLAKVVHKTLQIEGVDVAAAIKYTKGANTICLAGAAHLKHARELESALLVYMAVLPEKKRKNFTANAVKLTDTIKAHKMTLDLPLDAQDSLGSSDAYMTFLEDAVYVTIGENAVNRLKEMLEMKPKEGPSLLVEVTPERAGPLMELASGQKFKVDWSKLFPNNKKVKLLGLHLEGGSMLRVRYSADFVDILKIGILVAE